MALDPAKLRFFADFIEAKLGIVYAEANHFQLERRLQEIATLLGARGPDELYERAKGGIDGAFQDLLLDVATNNETSFFRDASMFRALEDVVVPSLLKDHPPRSSLRIWSAAASTGQEAYSVAMTLERMRAAGTLPVPYSLLATDFSERVLKQAAEGVYSQLEVQRGLPARNLVQCFVKQGDARWAIKPEYKAHVSFRKLNLLGDWPGIPTFDLVLCRNVLIYQSPANKSKVVRRIHDRLAPGGILILGATESLIGAPERALFREEHAGGAFFYRKAA